MDCKGKGFLGVAFATKEASWNPLKHSYLWSVQPFLCDVLDEFGRCDGGGGAGGECLSSKGNE